MIKTLVFDIGNVLVEWNPIPYIRKVLGPDVDAAWWNRAVFEGVEWKNGDEGIFSRRQTREALTARYPDKAEEIGRLLDGCDGILVESGRNAKLLEKLHRAGFELYFLPTPIRTLLSICRKPAASFRRWTAALPPTRSV